ncbi:hypothetical protein FACS1894113_0820 [Alphaproteobacteria bacterium]|nr:hypothetical protein FACS1894113_0820 [Alphaproteobacteria bacterium]
MNTIIEKSEFRALDIAVLKWHLRLESNLEAEYLYRIIDITNEALENETAAIACLSVANFSYLPDSSY